MEGLGAQENHGRYLHSSENEDRADDLFLKLPGKECLTNLLSRLEQEVGEDPTEHEH